MASWLWGVLEVGSGGGAEGRGEEGALCSLQEPSGSGQPFPPFYALSCPGCSLSPASGLCLSLLDAPFVPQFLSFLPTGPWSMPHLPSPPLLLSAQLASAHLSQSTWV